MAQYKVPENLDIEYKFIGGRYSLKDLLIRSCGLLLALPFGLGTYLAFESIVPTVIVVVISFVLGFYYSGKKLFDGSITLFSAMKYHNESKTRSKLLINKRRDDKEEFHRLYN